MSYYVIQVFTGEEKPYLAFCRYALRDEGDVTVHWLRRKNRIRRRGAFHDVEEPIFRGYLFVEADDMNPRLYTKLRRIPGFIRFLPNNINRQPLDGDEERVLVSIMQFGDTAPRSLVRFDENDRIRVISGPLKDCEGRIIRVDRRRRRAKIRLDQQGVLTFTLSYDVLADSTEPESVGVDTTGPVDWKAINHR